ncbi:MAG: YfhO family protein [Lachnospiraceae bacterium]|nr:YfhO family protein [Lachnospiraceae bacterium]
MEQVQELSKKQKILLHSLATLIPILILGTVFALRGVYPFGDETILYQDFWQQYYPFISEFWHRVREGGSLLWSWRGGGGHDYTAHFAYYLSSPFNFLAILFPHAFLREILTLFVLFRIGLAGLFMSLFLRLSLKKCDMLLPVFSSFYALSAYVLGYFPNIIWFDAIAIFPLVMLGVHALITDGKYRLYTISLALTVLFNFYIGLIICIFVSIIFFAWCFMAKLSLRNFFRRFLTILVCSTIALGMAAVLLLPAYSALQNSYRATTAFPAFEIYRHFTDVLGNFIAFTPPTIIAPDGIPNLYSGMISIMLIPIFILSNKISLKKSIAYISVLVLLILSTNISILNFIWDGFTVTHAFPFRFSFIIPFVVITIAYQAYFLLNESKKTSVLLMGFATAFLLIMAWSGAQDTRYVIYNLILSMVYLVLFVFIITAKKQHIFKYLLCAIMFTELSLTAFNGITTRQLISRTEHTLHYDSVQQLLEKRHTEKDTDFFRTEYINDTMRNNPAFYGYDGISFFSSFANMNTNRFVTELGLQGDLRVNHFNYVETSPLNSAFFNIRYLITQGQIPVDDAVLWSYVTSKDDIYLFQNNYYLPFGFMVNNEAATYTGSVPNPFDSQNDLFRKATGLNEDLFTIIEPFEIISQHYSLQYIGDNYALVLDEDKTEGVIQLIYEIHEDGLLYFYTEIPGVHLAYLMRGETEEDILKTLFPNRPFHTHLFPVPNTKQDTFFSINITSNPEIITNWHIFVGILNQDVFTEGIALLSNETLALTHFSDTRIVGNITVAEPRLLYTSLPHANNWRVFVNDAEKEIITIGGAMAGVRLDTGIHTVEFRYHNRSVIWGSIISILSFLIYLILLFLHHKIKKKATINNMIHNLERNL